MRTCRRCEQLLPIENFHRDKRSKDGRLSICNTCTVARVRAWQIETGRRSYVPNTRRRTNLYSQEFRKQYLDDIRNVPCKDCGGRFPTVAMDFDHLPGSTKSFGIMNGWRWRGWDLMLAEIAKCEIVCSNCHRVRTASRR